MAPPSGTSSGSNTNRSHSRGGGDRPRYLCQAPRPDVWDQLAQPVLQRLPGATRAIRVATVRTTIQLAKERNPFTPKTGPGRKTSAEHAIGFYEYLLECLLEGNNTDDDRGGGEATTDVNEKTELEAVSKVMDDPSSRPDEEQSSLDENQHNDLCEICDGAGELLMCCTCNLVFHLPCVRPIMEALPDEDWSCAYCVMSSDHPKHSKVRREAAAAVRIMARLRNRSKREKEAESFSSRVEATESKAVESSTIITNATDEKKCSASGNGVASEDPLSEGEGATPGKRARRQPTLYNPQDGPARKWQTDELLEWKAMRSTADTDDGSVPDDDETDRPMSPRKAARASDDMHWCNFCGDDPSILFCCFCACRVCFGKHHQTKLLLCDQCDNEYHTFCLKPELAAIPKRKWFCPDCAKSEGKGVTRTASRAGEARARKEEISSSAKPSASTKKISQEKKPNTPPLPKRDSVGRFIPASSGKKRGRPPKVITSPSKKIASPDPPRKRGRPRKPKTGTSASKDSKKRDRSRSESPRRSVGRPVKKVDTSVAGLRSLEKTLVEAPVEAAPPSPVAVSRSGRTLKRSTFHDEIGRGEQHLRSDATLSTRPASVMSVCPPSEGKKPAELDSSKSSRSASPPPPRTMTERCAKEADTDNTMEASLQKPLKQMLSPPAQSPAPLVQTQLIATTPLVPAAAVANSGPLVQGQLSPHASILASVPATSPASRSLGEAAQMALSNASKLDATVEDAEERRYQNDKTPRRKPGARECMQISRRFGADIIPDRYMDILMDYCNRGKVEHLIRMRERLDDHSRFLESQLAGLEVLVQQKKVMTQAVESTDTMASSTALHDPSADKTMPLSVPTAVQLPAPIVDTS
jgi:hypothetical protein